MVDLTRMLAAKSATPNLNDSVCLEIAAMASDQNIEANSLRAFVRQLDLRHQHIDGIDIRGLIHLRQKNIFKSLARLERVDDIALHGFRIDPIDANLSPQLARDRVATGCRLFAGATAFSKSSKVKSAIDFTAFSMNIGFAVGTASWDRCTGHKERTTAIVP